MEGERAGTGSPARFDRDPPLIAGRIHGVRVWSLMWSSDGGLALTGYGGGAGEGGAGCAHVPAPECGCGLYARHPFADEARWLGFGPPHPEDCLSPLGEVDVA